MKTRTELRKQLRTGFNLVVLSQVVVLGCLLGNPLVRAQTNPRPKAVMPAPVPSQPLPAVEDQPDVNLLNQSALRPLMIRNQGQTSYCFAVAATALFDVWNVRHSSDASAYRRSSSLEVAKAKSISGTGGGDVRQALDYVFARGACQDAQPQEIECLPKHGSLEKALGSGCIRNRAKVQAQPRMLSRNRSKNPDTQFEDDLLSTVDQQLNRGMPVAVSLCETHVRLNEPGGRCQSKSSLHAALVVGRGCNQTRRGFGCFYLVHLFKGTSLEAIELSSKYRRRDRQEPGTGSVWMSAEELQHASSDVYRLEPKTSPR